jgi:hypothetical protein
MKKWINNMFWCLLLIVTGLPSFSKNNQATEKDPKKKPADSDTIKSAYPGNVKFINKKDNGFRGIWYHIGDTKNEYKVKYGGGLGTYPSNHYPFSVYVPKVNKTFFCYGGTDEATGRTLYHEVAYFDHKTKMVSRPTILLDKATDDAHDNPVIQVDKDGYIWIFSTSHGTGRPSFIHRSFKPYDISSFINVNPVRWENGKKVPLDNFSYLQIYYTPARGFIGLFTHYETRELGFGKKECRDIACMTSNDGVIWSEWKFIAKIEEGHYQTSGQAKGGKLGTSFNYHPNKKDAAGLDYRTNLYYLYTDDGNTFKTADGKKMDLPLTTTSNDALVHDYASEGLNVYINDLNYDQNGNPVILYEVGTGHDPGPKYGQKQWLTAHWTGKSWQIFPVTTSDNNYDMGSLYIEQGLWRIIGPTTDGPQAYNTGGEITMWTSNNQGKSWIKEKQLTHNSEFNQSYPRRPVNANPDFYAFWADGNGRVFSKSRLYFADKAGNVYKLPEKMDGEMMKPILVK